jgi:hypothetical protein
MPLISRSRPDRHLGQVVGGTLLGAALVATGLSLAFLTIDTPFVSRLVPTSHPGSSQLTTSMIVWALALIAGACLLVAGTDRLATTIAAVRSRRARRAPVMRAMGELPEDVVVASGVVPQDGRPIPELVIGPFGVAVVHEMEAGDRIRRVGTSWEIRTRDGWVPAEQPLERVARDAERVRHWLTSGDLDFVVRVYAALVTTDTSVVRSSSCAVITPEQIPAWIAALPRQRSLTAGRLEHLLARVREAVVDEVAGRGWAGDPGLRRVD